jgi:hypothetical protein
MDPPFRQQHNVHHQRSQSWSVDTAWEVLPDGKIGGAASYNMNHWST